MPKVLIFGANGFVGGYLAKELGDHGYETIGSDIANSPSHDGFAGYYAADLLDASGVSRIFGIVQPDAVVNLAAISSVSQSWKIPALTMQVNIVGVVNILEAARTQPNPPKILLVGSSEEYAPQNRPLKEDDPLDAASPYGISKITQERIADLYQNQYGLCIFRTRSFNHTGPGQNSKFVIPGWCKQVANIERVGKSGKLCVGNIKVERDFSDVRDVVRAYRLILESEYAGETFNIGSGTAVPLYKIAELVCSLSKQRVELQVDESRLRHDDTHTISANYTKINSLLGWSPHYDLPNTLREVYNYFLNGQESM